MSTQNDNDNSSSSPVLYFMNSDAHEALAVSDIEDKILPEGDINIELSPEDDDDGKPITTASHSRRVHFPIDDSQLRLISYAPEPFANKPLLSLNVILQRYRGVCQRLQIRPLNSLLDQLSTMDDGRKSYYDRLDCLRIAHEKIDVKHVEAIEEILSHCRFHTLDFDSTSIDDTALVQLFDIIEYYESCTHINLSNSRSIGIQGYQALTKYLRKTNSLERLDMNSARFDESSILNFTRSIRLSSTLYELHVESCQLSGKLLQKFIQNLRSCTVLRELYLCDNRLQVQDSLLINELIRTCGRFLFLLDLRSNALQDTGISHLSSQFSQYDENHTNENVLHKISFQANQITQKGAGFLAKSLLHNRTLRSLNLSNNPITNEGLIALRDSLLTNRTINELILRNCHLTDAAAIALAEFIAESTTIQYIDLRENNIQASGICGMSIAMKNNKSLLKLDFDPLISTPTNLGSLSNSNNRTAYSGGLLSMANIRRMTTGFGSFTSSTTFNSYRTGGGGTRELLEQKARWMNDIAAVCQRNILIYEEKLRLEEEEQQQQQQENKQDNETDRKDSIITQPGETYLKEQDTDQYTTNENSSFDDSAVIVQHDHEEIIQSVDTTINTTDTIENFDNSSHSSNHEENEPNHLDNTDADSEQPITVPVEDKFHESIDIPDSNDTDATDTSINDNCENGQLAESLVEPMENNNHQESLEPNNVNQTSRDNETSSTSDIVDDSSHPIERKLRHTDSIRLRRKIIKIGHDEDVSDDESRLSPPLE